MSKINDIVDLSKKVEQCIGFGSINGKAFINDDFTVDVEGDVDFHFVKMKSLPFNFRSVTRNFNIAFCGLTSLKGCPEEIGGDFVCCGNRMRNLKDGPKIVDGNFDISNCSQIRNLKNSPVTVGGDYLCMNCKNLESLEGITHCIQRLDVSHCINLHELKYIDHDIHCLKLIDLDDISFIDPKLHPDHVIFKCAQKSADYIKQCFLDSILQDF